MQTSMVWWVKRPRLQSDLDSFSAQPYVLQPWTSQFLPLGYSFCIYKIVRPTEKGEVLRYGEGQMTIYQKCTHKQTAAPEASFRWHDSVSSGNSLFFLFLLHTMKYTFAITTLPGRVAFERHLLCNLELPKMTHNAPLEETLSSATSSSAPPNPCLPAADPSYIQESPGNGRRSLDGEAWGSFQRKLRCERRMLTGREADCYIEGTKWAKALGEETHEHQREQKRSPPAGNAKMVQDKTAETSGPDHILGVWLHQHQLRACKKCRISSPTS